MAPRFVALRPLCLALWFATLSGPVKATEPCDSIEYTEVRDWPVQQVQEAYCRDTAAKKNIVIQYGRYAALRNSAYDDARFQGAAAACQKQIDLYERVLKNVHHQPVPTCL